MVDETKPDPQYPEGDTRNLTWPEYFKGVYANVPPSAKKFGEGLVHGLNPANISETIQGMGALGRGALYNLTGYNPPHAGEPMPETAVTPVQKMQARRQGYGESLAQIEQEKALASDVGKGLPPIFKYTREGGYQGFDPEKWHEFGQRFYEDPIGTASLASAPVSGAGGVGSKIAGTAARTAEAANLPTVAKALDVARKAGNVAEAAKYADPTTAALGVAGLVGEGATAAASRLTGIDDFEGIKNLYAQTGADASKLRDIYKQYSSGQGNYERLMQDVKDWVKDYRQNRINEWASKKQDLVNRDIPMGDVATEVQNQINALGEPEFKFTAGSKEAIDFLRGEKDPRTGRTIPGKEGLLERLHNIEALPPGHPEKNLLSLDKQKQYLWDVIQSNRGVGQGKNNALADALTPIHNKLVESLTNYGDKNYASLMKEFQDIQNEVAGITAASGSGMNKVAQFKRMMSSRKNPVGRTYLDLMSEKNPEIGAALLGASSPSNLLPSGMSGLDILSVPASAAAYYYHPVAGAALGAIEAGKLGLSSPGLTTGTAKLAGALERNPVTSSAKSVLSTAPVAARTVSPFQSNLESAYDRMINQKEEEAAARQIDEMIKRQQASGGRIGRATGGRTGSDAKAKADKLISMVDNVRKSIGNETSSLLNLDDTTVAKALAVANRGI